MSIRAFGDTLGDAQGIIKVDGATSGDCHYPPERIVSLALEPQQHIWVAEEMGRLVGFVSAFSTHSLAGSRWEVDLLAVHPAAQRRALGTALVARAVAGSTAEPGLTRSRALVAANNLASQRVFIKNGFSTAHRVHLLRYEVAGRVPRAPQASLPSVRPAQLADVPVIADLSGCNVDRVTRLLRRPGNVYVVAEGQQRIRGYVELIHVRTLLYEGVWVESLHVAGSDSAAASALFSAAIEEAKRREAVEEVGHLVALEERALYDACVRQGFHHVNEYLVLMRELNVQ